MSAPTAEAQQRGISVLVSLAEAQEAARTDTAPLPPVITEKDGEWHVADGAGDGDGNPGPYQRGARDGGRREAARPGTRQRAASPPVTVLIPAHNEEKVLAECLDSVRAQAVQPQQVIVVADSCTDDTAGVARRHGAQVVTSSAGGKAGAQDAGLPYVTGDVLVCVDADTQIAPDVIGLFLAELKTADATCANMLPVPSQRGFWVANRRFAYALARYWWRWAQARVGRLMVLSGCAYALRTETVRALGGFPGELITCDMDLTWSLYGAGYRTSFCQKALAYTYDPETFRVYLHQMRRWSAGFYQNFARHWRTVLRSPAAILVVGSLLYDLLSLPVLYFLAAWYAARNPASASWLWRAIALHAIVTVFIVSRTVGWKKAVVSFIPYYLVNFLNKGIYLWTFVREWILGKHLMSWTGRQGRAKEITPMTRARRLALSGIAAAALGAAGCVAGVNGASHPPSPAPAAATPPPVVPVSRASSRYLGVATPSLAGFDAAIGVRANLSARYLRWGQPFPSARVARNASLGAETLLEIEPWGVPLGAVAAGRRDAWLRSVAAGIAASRDQVMVSFAPEMDGGWYPWGAAGNRPAVFAAAWRHVHQVLAGAGARRVTWLWQVSPVAASRVPLRSLWPGSAYVNMTGIDAYFYTPANTFAGVFGRTIAAVRSLSGGLPVLISETAAGPRAGQAAKIADLFAGLRAYQLAGLVWFDIAQHAGIRHQDWKLEDSPAALAAFREAVRRWP